VGPLLNPQSEPGMASPPSLVSGIIRGAGSAATHGFVLCDQAIVSGANFLTTVAIARGVSLGEFGQYTLLWMSIMFCMNVQMAVLTSPMMSVGPLQKRVPQNTYLGVLFAHQLLYTIGSTAFLGLLLAVMHVAFPAFSLSLILPVLCASAAYQLQDFGRRILFYLGKQFPALLNDGISYLGQLAWVGYYLHKHILTVSAAFWINAITSLIALLVAIPLLPRLVAAPALLRVVFRRNWKSGRYLVGATLLQWTSGNLFSIVAPLFLGAVAAGVMRACQSITNMTNVWLQGLENSLPTEASKTMREGGVVALRRYLRNSGTVLMAFTGLVALLVVAAPEYWLKIIYGEHLHGYGFVLRAYALLSFGVVATLPLRAGLRALEQTRPILIGYIATTVYSFITAPLLAKTYGLHGVVWGLVGTQVILLPMLFLALRNRLRTRDGRTIPSSALLVNCWHDSNKGDAAISIGVINALKKNAVADVIRVSSYVYYPTLDELNFGFRHVKAAHPDVQFVQTALPAKAKSVGSWKSLMLAIRGAFKLLFPGLIPDMEMEAAVRESSVVVSNGGLYFGFAKTGFFFSLYHLLAFSYPMLLARRLGVPYVLYAQSFGPFRDALSRNWMKWLVAGSSGTWARESYSRDVLKSVGAPESKLDVVADAAFGLRALEDAEPVLRIFGLERGGYVAISARSLDASGHSAELEENYRASFVSLIEWLVSEKQLRVLLVAHTTGPVADEDDRVTSRTIRARLSPEGQDQVRVVEEDLSPSALASLYGSAALVISTRFHAFVLSLCGGAPSIAIPYFGLKTQGSLRDMGLSELLLEVKDLSFAVLKDKCELCLSENENLRAKVQAVTQERYDAAMATGERLRGIVEAKEFKTHRKGETQRPSPTSVITVSESIPVLVSPTSAGNSYTIAADPQRLSSTPKGIASK
jgi:polysaccharide pyruvyl transferase WcaK-like protein/O-antigen/teichoic acid export membrane protein